MKCCLHRPHLGLDGGLGDVARVGADGSRTVCTIASPAKIDTKWCQLKILVPPLPSKLKFSNPAKKSIKAGRQSVGGAVERRGGAPVRGRRGAGAGQGAGTQGRRGAGAGQGTGPRQPEGVVSGRGVGARHGLEAWRPAWRRGTARRQLGEGGVSADALTTVSNKLPCQNQDKVLSLQVSKPCKKKHALN